MRWSAALNLILNNNRKCKRLVIATDLTRVEREMNILKQRPCRASKAERPACASPSARMLMVRMTVPIRCVHLQSTSHTHSSNNHNRDAVSSLAGEVGLGLYLAKVWV